MRHLNTLIFHLREVYHQSPIFADVVVVVQSLGEGELIAGSTLTLETWSIKHMVAVRGCHPILMLL